MLQSRKNAKLAIKDSKEQKTKNTLIMKMGEYQKSRKREVNELGHSVELRPKRKTRLKKEATHVNLVSGTIKL